MLSRSAGSMGRIWWLILTGAIFIMGGALVWESMHKIILTRHSNASWFSAECRVDRMTVRETIREHTVGRGAKQTRSYYSPEATCTYAVTDMSLPSSETTFTHAIPIHENFPGLSGKRKAEQWLEDHYSADMLLIIYYNPENPKQAVLQPEIRSWPHLMFLASTGVLLMFCGSVLLLAYFGIPKAQSQG